MKLVLFGATGHIGHAILEEALARGHEVTAIVRDASRLTERDDKLHVVVGDITHPASWLPSAQGAAAVIASLSPRRDGNNETLPNAAKALLDNLPGAGVTRLLWVGGAGSLETSPGVRVLDDPHFPDAWKAEAESQARALDVFRHSKADIDWTFISPAALIEDGARTGTYRVGGDQLLTDASGHSRISVPDYAVALLDRLDENDKLRQRITVAY
jgi:uncharacterized protein